MFIYLLRYIFQITDLINYENDLGEYLHKILLEDKILSSMEFSQNPKSFEEMINSYRLLMNYQSKKECLN